MRKGFFLDRPIKRITSGVALMALISCVSPSIRELPPGSPFSSHDTLRQGALSAGVATGDVTSHSAQVWFRTEGPERVRVTWWPEQKEKGSGEDRGQGKRKTTEQSLLVNTDEAHDFTKTHTLQQLKPDTPYRYEVEILSSWQNGEAFSPEPHAGFFVTAPADEELQPFRFVWSGDLGGQGHCRPLEGEYEIFEKMQQAEPQFAILLGDLVYADESCPSPPNQPGSDFIARTLSEYRAKHRYQRGDPSLRRFLGRVPIYAQWDDHEVVNDFSGPVEPLMPVGRQAFREYWPIQPQGQDPDRLFRCIRYGKNLELFLLDTRQYRSPNRERDGPNKTMLGEAQLQWFLTRLRESTATWKFVISSVPLAISKERRGKKSGNDSWARGRDGTGFQRELLVIVETIISKGISNVVWLTGDVHFAQVNAYDPDRDGTRDFLELIGGPLSAGTRKAVAPLSDLHPSTLFSRGAFTNFVVVSGDQRVLMVEYRDQTGAVRYRHSFPAQLSS